MPLVAYAQNTSTEYTLGTGDKIRVIVFEEEDLSGEHDVGANGYISIPLIGEVRAAGFGERGGAHGGAAEDHRRL